MKPTETLDVTSSNFKNLRQINNLTKMQSINDWKHSVLQRLIIVFLGLLTVGALMQSCTASHASCAAYNRVEQPESK